MQYVAVTVSGTVKRSAGAEVPGSGPATEQYESIERHVTLKADPQGDALPTVMKRMERDLRRQLAIVDPKGDVAWDEPAFRTAKEVEGGAEFPEPPEALDEERLSGDTGASDGAESDAGEDLGVADADEMDEEGPSCDACGSETDDLMLGRTERGKEQWVCDDCTVIFLFSDVDAPDELLLENRGAIEQDAGRWQVVTSTEHADAYREWAEENEVTVTEVT